VYRTNIYLDEEQTRALKHLAAEEGSSVAELVRRAVDVYLAQRFGDRRSWDERFDALVARIQSRVPKDLGPDEIEADITAARREVRERRRAARLADASGR